MDRVLENVEMLLVSVLSTICVCMSCQFVIRKHCNKKKQPEIEMYASSGYVNNLNNSNNSSNQIRY